VVRKDIILPQVVETRKRKKAGKTPQRSGSAPVVKQAKVIKSEAKEPQVSSLVESAWDDNDGENDGDNDDDFTVEMESEIDQSSAVDDEVNDDENDYSTADGDDQDSVMEDSQASGAVSETPSEKNLDGTEKTHSPMPTVITFLSL